MYRYRKCHSGCMGSGDDNEYCFKKHEGSFWNEVNVLNVVMIEQYSLEMLNSTITMVKF